ncbi:unnamed protein product [Adineta ricciae]|uniref:Protein kinase domain-containing protein n=1 Tax=Adineta ricciae TaxID=249248 RepID=A0A815AZG0_ADIRI|nr:unnamed protein product [Adineta ricciae]
MHPTQYSNMTYPMPSRDGWLQNRTVHIQGEPFRLLNQLGQGRFASVWRSRTRDGYYAAVKVFDFNQARNNINSNQRLSSFENEIEMIRRLQNEIDYVVTLYSFDLDRQKQIGFIAMELGSTSFKDQLVYLHQTHYKSRRTGYDYIPAVERKNIWIQLVNIIWALHRHNIVHRDLKPANLVFFGPTLKLIDFGIAQDAHSLYNPHQRGGSHPYSAPECFTRQMPITSKADIWSIGAILYYTTYGKSPVHESPRAPMGIPPTQSNLVQSVLYHSLQRNPYRRVDHHWLIEHPLTKSNAAF